MTLITYLENINKWSELEESIARSRVVNTLSWEQDSYDLRES